jgi:hypothetical protein
VDTPFLAFGLVATALVAVEEPTRRRAALARVFAALMALTKQTGVEPMLALAGYLGLRSPRHLLLPFAAAAAAVGLLAGALLLGSGGSWT